ncbi:MAG: hypothetical protein C1943_17540 [Halochromatium sp.]|nr:hypothetical protein [Halochromatium sp.]
MLLMIGNAFGIQPKTRGQSINQSTSEQLLDDYYHISVYQSLLKKACTLAERVTHAAIMPYPNLAFGSSEWELKKRLGKPNLKLSPENALSEQLYLYRRLIAGYKVRFEFHFYQGALFYAKRVFRHTSREENDLIIENVRKKYLDDTEFNHRQAKIVDHQGNELIINTGVYLSLDYLNMQGPAFAQLRAWIEAGQQPDAAPLPDPSDPSE